MLSVVLLHDPNTANRTQNLITSLSWEQLDHSPYSPDLAGQRHTDDDEVKTTVMQWLSNQAATFFADGVQKLVPRYDKSLNGNYVEK